MNNHFPQYTTDYISGVMSLCKPQTHSLKILEEIVNSVQLRKGMNLKAALGAVHLFFGQAYSRNYIPAELYNQFCVNKETKIRMPKIKRDEDLSIA